jgi:hypothetical protein
MSRVEAAGRPRAVGQPTDPADPGVSPRSVVTGGESWVLIQLEDADSWELFTRDPRDGGRPGARLAHITITDRGYISVDDAGTRRGPYTTLDEAAYPIWTRDRVLLDDPGTRLPAEPAAAPVGPGGVVPPAGVRAAPLRAASPYQRLLVAVAGVTAGAVALGVVLGAIGRRR